jgi:hypothetical protein
MKWFWICILNVSVLHAQVDRYAVVINEIMVDPTPVVGLPNAEYIELRNCSNQTIDLNKWKIEKGNTAYPISTTALLKPDSIMVLCSKSNLNYFGATIRTIALGSFPTLINGEGILALKSPENKTIHAVAYQNAMHENTIKANGGWSLEMIDPQKPCEENNWTSSVHKNGGTPGTENSVFKKNTILNQFNIKQCVSVNDKTLLLQLKNGMDSSSLSNTGNYVFNGTSDNIEQAKAIGPLFNEALIYLKSALKANIIYSLQINNISSCKKEKTFEGVVRTGLLKDPLPNDILINEVLFNPPTDGEDFVELYNNSSAIINLNEIYLSSINQLGSWNTNYKVGEGYFNFFPGEYAVLTEDSSFIKKQWPKSDARKIIQLKTLPSMPDDDGNIAILDNQGKTIDKMNYTDKMHYPFIIDKSGVTLERIQFNTSANDPNNWHSASSTSNYGSPTLQNSQFKKYDSILSVFKISPTIISPNNDGIDDQLIIQYQMGQPGYMCTVYLFGLNGNLITKMIDNQLLGINGSMVWNGLNQERILPSGQYIILVEAFHLKGKTIKEKMLIAIK